MEIAFRWTFGEAWAGNINRILFKFLADRNVPTRGFLLQLENTTGDRVDINFSNGAGTQFSPLVNVWPFGSPDYGNFWWAKVRYERGVLYAKAWKDGSPEPGWQITWRPPNLGGFGNDVASVFHHFSTVTNTMFMDSISVTSLTEGCASGGSLVLPPTEGRYERVRRAPHSRLNPPTVVFPVLAQPIGTTLVRIRPVATRWVLRRPADLIDAEDLGFVRISLAYSLRGAPKSRLSPPTAVAPFFVRPIEATLARIRPVAVHWVLRLPVDLVDQQDVGFVRVHLVRIKPVPVHSALRSPVSIDLSPQAYYLDLHLAYSRRGVPKSFLRPASLFTPQPKAETVLAVTLAYSLRGKPKSGLGEPVVISAAALLRSADITLAPQRRGKPKPFLRAPVVVTAATPVRSLSIHLAYSKRGKPLSGLGAPKVMFPSSAFPQGPMVQYAASFRGRAKSRLAAPTAFIRFVARPIRVELVPQRRGTPKSVLRKPVVVQTFRVPVISTTLARITPPPVHSVLRKPTDLVDTQDLGFVRVQLAPSRFPIPMSRLSPPTVVDAFRIPVLSVTLARIRPVKTLATLKPPTDTVGAEDQGRVRVSLTRIRPVKTLAFLRPPTVIGAADAFFGPSVTLVRIRPVGTRKFLIPASVIDKECFGDVVGFDFAPEVCGSDEGATAVGATSSDQVSGSDSGATVQGASAAGGSVTGGDEKREGC
jgi:hypothetical protein